MRPKRCSPRGRQGRPADRGRDLRPLGLQFNDAVLLMDESGRLLDVNDRAVALYGHAREELLRLTVRDLRALLRPAGRVDGCDLFEVPAPLGR